MRSIGFTLFLALLAALSCGLAGWQWKEGNFDAFLGAPPTKVGERLYTAFTPADVKYIQVTQNGIVSNFELTDKGWQALVPWRDRMDPRAAVGIINFTLGMRVEDFAKADEIDRKKTGLRENGINIRLEGKDRRSLARYKLGRSTPWFATVKDIKENVPTVFVQPRDEDHKDHIYTCTGDISALFKDGLKYLRDHRPFYFNPITLQKMRIRTDEGELTLARADHKSPWRLVKPLDLATDPKALKTLLEGLYELQAAKISDRSAVTLPSKGSLAKSTQISLLSFGSETETVLEIFPPDSPTMRDVLATVSDRPETIFELPLKPEAGLTSLADLPLTINTLRDASLTNLNIASLRGVLIQPSNGSEILVTRTPPNPWMITIDGVSQTANEERLFTLLKSVTEGRAVDFVSDAATDFTPWGLNQPFLKLRFLGDDNQGLELAFGKNSKGEYFVNRLGTSTVMRVESGLVSSISTRPYEWRHARIWSVDRTNLMAIERMTINSPTLLLRYNPNDGDWSANSEGKDITSSLNPSRATYLIGVLEGLKVTRWLAETDESANQALLTPSLVFKIVEKGTNEMDDFTGLISREVAFAPGSTGPNPGFYYGRTSTGSHPFLLDRETYGKLALELLDPN